MITVHSSIQEVVNSELTDKEILNLWYDYFCKSSSLVNKGRALIRKLKKIYKLNELSGRKYFDPNKTYVFFKNNCPCCGSLYDDFRICDLETREVIFIIQVNRYDQKHSAELWGQPNNFDGAILEGSIKDVYNYFN